MLRGLMIAALVAIHGLVPARPGERAAPACADRDTDAGQDRSPLWPRIGEAISVAFATAASIRAAARKVRDLAHEADSVSRASRWLDLAKKIIVGDMLAVLGDRRLESQE